MAGSPWAALQPDISQDPRAAFFANAQNLPLVPTPTQPPVAMAPLLKPKKAPATVLKPDPYAIPPELAAQMAAIDAAGQGQLEAQNQGLGDLRSRLEAATKRDLPLDLTPLAALTDQWSGSNFSQSYKPGETAGDRRAEIGKLQNALAEGQMGLAKDQTDLLKGKLQTALGFDERGFTRGQQGIDNDFKRQELDIMRAREEREKEAAGAVKDSVGQEAIDRAFGKDYADYVAGGGSTSAEKNLQQLEVASQRLSADESLTGTKVGLTPDFMLSKTNPNAMALKEDVQQIVMGSMRALLGSAFTEKEGLRVVNATFNPSLPASVNAERLARLKTQMSLAFEQKRRAAEHFEQNGASLKGFKGYMPSVDELISGVADAPKQAVPTGKNRTAKDFSDAELDAEIARLKKEQGEH